MLKTKCTLCKKRDRILKKLIKRIEQRSKILTESNGEYFIGGIVNYSLTKISDYKWLMWSTSIGDFIRKHYPEEIKLISYYQKIDNICKEQLINCNVPRYKWDIRSEIFGEKWKP